MISQKNTITEEVDFLYFRYILKSTEAKKGMNTLRHYHATTLFIIIIMLLPNCSIHSDWNSTRFFLGSTNFYIFINGLLLTTCDGDIYNFADENTIYQC